jgi:hypothetical protein
MIEQSEPKSGLRRQFAASSIVGQLGLSIVSGIAALEPKELPDHARGETFGRVNLCGQMNEEQRCMAIY